MTIRVLVNASTLVVGGGIQIGKSFVDYASRVPSADFRFVFAVSTPIYENLTGSLQRDERVALIRVSPARILKGRRSRRSLKRLEAGFRPDIVYTLGLPSYCRFRSTEVGRYTNPWEIYPSPLALSVVPFKERLTLLLRTHYRLFWARRASYYETQTEAARRGIIERLRVSGDRVKVVPNSPNPMFMNDSSRLEIKPLTDTIVVYCLAAAYRHKNLTIIPEVAERLRHLSKDTNFRFLTTVPETSQIGVEIAEKSERLGVTEMIENLGPLTLRECLRWYQEADVVFLPTLLEVFSATYVEAMAMARPVVTPDLDFARDVCGDAALYYEPLSPSAAAEAIMSLTMNRELREKLVERGRLRLGVFPDPDTKHAIVLSWLRDIVTRREGGVLRT